LSYLKDKEEIEADNGRTLHFAMIPLRLLYQILAGLGLVGMMTGWFVIRHTGWIVDLGPRSERARQEVVDQLSKSLDGDFNTGQKMVDVTVSFVDRAGGTYTYEGDSPEAWKQKDHFWVTNRAAYLDDSAYFSGEDQVERYRTLLAFILTAHRERMPLLGFSYCHTGNPGIFDTKLGKWGEREDPEYLVARKSGRMRRDYETAAIMVAALRSALAHLKAGQTLASVYGPAAGKPLENSYCNADGADPAVLSPAPTTAYRAATYDIHLYDAPQVTFRYVWFGFTELDSVKRWNEAGARIIGMCIDGHTCEHDEGLTPHTTLYGDLFAAEPPLSPAQLAAERELLRTVTLDFWIEEAKKNGITDTAPLVDEFQAALRDLATTFGERS
jgi:hypothetical protein